MRYDILIGSNSASMINEAINLLNNSFEIPILGVPK